MANTKADKSPLGKVSEVSKVSKVSNAGPMTMADLLASTGYKIPILKRGQEVKGKVVSASRSEIIVDIGAKSEGIVYGREIAANPDLLMNLVPGDPIEATVIYPENEQGQVVLSLRKHSGNRRWGELDEKKDTGETIEVVASEVNKGGIICEFFGIRGFLPASQLSQIPTKLGDLVGKKLTVSIIEADQATNRLIFSQKQQKDLEAIRKVLAMVKIGEKYKGVVTAILPFGVFVEIGVPAGPVSSFPPASARSTKLGSDADSDGGELRADGSPSTAATRRATDDVQKIEGLVHLSEISWEKTEDPTKGFSVGQEVEVLVVSKDEESGRLNLSTRQLTEDPFMKVSKQYSKSQKVGGKVSKVTPYGVFVTLESGLEGLIHISKIPPSLGLNVGDKIECEVESVDTASRRIALVPVITEKPVLYR